MQTPELKESRPLFAQNRTESAALVDHFSVYLGRPFTATLTSFSQESFGPVASCDRSNHGRASPWAFFTHVASSFL